MSEARYDLISAAPFTSCQCGNKQLLIMSKGGPMGGNPAFYICFKCQSIGEIGVGPVLRRAVEKAEA